MRLRYYGFFCIPNCLSHICSFTGRNCLRTRGDGIPQQRYSFFLPPFLSFVPPSISLPFVIFLDSLSDIAGLVMPRSPSRCRFHARIFSRSRLGGLASAYPSAVFLFPVILGRESRYVLLPPCSASRGSCGFLCGFFFAAEEVSSCAPAPLFSSK